MRGVKTLYCSWNPYSFFLLCWVYYAAPLHELGTFFPCHTVDRTELRKLFLGE